MAHVGQVEVATAGGKQVLTKSGDMTHVQDGTTSPSTVTTVDPAYVAAAFGDALAVEPAPSEKFILYFESGSRDPAGGFRVDDSRHRCRRRPARGGRDRHLAATPMPRVPIRINDQLALARAEKVRDLLVQQGVAPVLMSVASHGKGNPAIPTAEGVAEPRNRRVEVIVQ